MKCHTVRPFFAAVLFLCLGSISQSETITFDVGLPVEENGYVEKGMRISSTAATTNPEIARIRDWQSSVGHNTPNFGERELLGNNPGIRGFQGEIYIFSLLSGKKFDLLSLDVEDPHGTGEFWSMLGSAEIIGSNGVKVTLESTDLGTHVFGNTFLGISQFTIQYVPVSQVTFDNITFAIPEPGTLMLLGLSCFGVGSMRRNRIRTN